MKKPFLCSLRTLAFTVSKGRYLPYKRIAFLVAVTALGGGSSCQRAPQAYFAPTPHPAAQRLTITPPTPEPVATASVKEEIPVSTKPVWEQTTEPTFEPTVAAKVAEPTRKLTLAKRLFGSKSVPPQCDQIVLRNGDVVEAKIKEVGVNEIKYKKCDRPDGPDYTIAKRDVLSIKYTNGDVERFNATPNSYNNSSSSGGRSSYDSPTNPQNDGPRTDPFAIVAIATGGLAILTGYGAFLLGAAAVVFGAISLSRIRREPGRFKGKGLALGGMIAGIVAAGLILLYILF
ncbi:DUF4190 domain-containing protein [Spirosoma soli]|uniref:DUF4190 domain-containing protein n=1 Tax=Spirosoma soli TaxID=1770529 RepID=A0ABW5LZP2_9BACT